MQRRDEHGPVPEGGGRRRPRCSEKPASSVATSPATTPCPLPSRLSTSGLTSPSDPPPVRAPRASASVTLLRGGYSHPGCEYHWMRRFVALTSSKRVPPFGDEATVVLTARRVPCRWACWRRSSRQRFGRVGDAIADDAGPRRASRSPSPPGCRHRGVSIDVARPPSAMPPPPCRLHHFAVVDGPGPLVVVDGGLRSRRQWRWSIS